MELLRHAEFDVSRRAILMVSSVTDIMNLVRSQDIMRDYFIVTFPSDKAVDSASNLSQRANTTLPFNGFDQNA